MFDLTKAISIKALSLSQSSVFTAIGLALLLAVPAPGFSADFQVPSGIELTKKGFLRVLYQGSSDQNLSKKRSAQSMTQVEYDLLERFATENQLQTEWIAINEDWQLMPALLEGHGDIILGQGESLVSGIVDQIRFTHTWGTTRQQVVVRTDTTQIKSLEDLFVRQIALKKSSPSWSTLEKYATENPAMGLLEIPETVSQEEIMQRVASGQYDITIVDSDYLQGYLPTHPELIGGFNFSKAEPRAWALRSDAEVLQKQLDEFLNKNHLSRIVTNVRFDDLPKIKQRKILRVITYQSPGNYFFSHGKMHGFEYRLIRKFAESKSLAVDVVLANSHAEMRELLLNGDGDIIAASLPTSSLQHENIKMSTAYDYSAPVIIGRDSENTLVDVRDLAGRRIALAPESPYRDLLESLQQRGIDFEIVETDEAVNRKGTLARVSYSMYDLTILGSHQVNSELAQHDGLKALFSLSEPLAQSWAVREGNHRLLGAVNEFIDKEYRRGTYNYLYSKYLSRPQNINNSADVIVQAGTISPYDALVKKNAEKYSFDWRLIAAQMYQESQFDPEAVSYAGAEGLMQIMPATADELGVEDLHDPKSNITAGVKYMNILRAQFEQELPLEDKTWLTLASYNAGFTRVKNARMLAKKMGLDGDRWFGHVEKAMLVLAKPYERDGEIRRLCRCGQTVIYVREIRALYHNYVRLSEATQIARAETLLSARDI